MTSTSVELLFADGEYCFALKLPQLAELQAKRGCGIFALYGRVMAGRGVYEGRVIGLSRQGEAHAEDLFETIRLGLIGGGYGMVDGQRVEVNPIVAKRLVDSYVVDAPLKEAWATAAAVLGAKIEGYTPPKSEPAEAPEPIEPATVST